MSAFAGRRFIAFAALLLATAGHAHALDRALNVASGDWNSAGSWTPSGVPGAGDVVTISNGTVTLNSDTSIAGLIISGGTLTGTGTLTVTGPFTWSGGAMTGSGSTIASAGMTMSGNPKTLTQRTLTLSAGGATLDGPNSYVLLGNGATLNNQTTFDCSNDGGHTNQQGFRAGSGGGTFNNSGTLRKTATGNTGVTVVGVAFNNSGSAQVLAGALRLGGGGNSPSGTFTATAPGGLVFGGTHQLGATSGISGSGMVEFDLGTTTLAGSYDITGGTSATGGTGNFTGTVTHVGPLLISGGALNFSSSGLTIATSTLTLSGGTLTGDDTLTCSGLLTWSGGTMSGTGATVATAGTMLIGAPKSLSQRVLTLSGGAATLDGPTSYVLLSTGATINNQVTLDCSNDGGHTNQQGFFPGSGSGTFNNSGVLRKTATGNTGATVISVPFNNTGSAEVLAGALRLSGGGNSPTGTLTVTAPGQLEFGGTHQLGAASSIGGSGTVEFDLGTTTMAGSYNVTGGTSATGGTGNFIGTVTNVGPLLISSGTLNFSSSGSTIATSTLTQSGGTLTGDDTVTCSGLFTWSGGTMSGTGTTVASAGTMLVGAPKSLALRTLTLSGGAATLDGPSSYVLLSTGATINNQVTLDCSNDGGHINQQGFLPGSGGGTFNNSGTLRKSATGNTGTTVVSVTFNNTGSAQVLAGALRLSGGGNSPTGSFAATAPGALVFGGTHQLGANSTVAGSGTVEFDIGATTLAGAYDIAGGTTATGGSGTFTGTVTSVGPLTISSGMLAFNSNGPTVATTTLQQTGGTLTGEDTVTLSGALTWTGGTMSGTGATIAAGGALLTTGPKTLSQRTLTLSGGAAMLTGPFTYLVLASGATLNNQVTLDCLNDDGHANQQGVFPGSGGGTFNNSGTLRKAAGNTGATVINVPFHNSGTVEVLAATLHFGNSYSQTAGVTRISAGTLDSQMPVTLTGGRLEGRGTIDGNVSNGGEAAPGLSPGQLTITGTYTQTAAGVLTAEIGGLTPDAQHDRLAVGGAATLSGTLNLSIVNGFAPQLGQTFDVMTFPSHSGQFAQTGGLGIGGGLAFAVHHLADRVRVEVVQGDVPTASVTPTSVTTTPTASATTVATLTPSAPATPSATATSAVSPTGTASPSATQATATATATSVLSATAAATASASATPTVTASATATVTPSLTASATFSATPSATAIPTATATATGPQQPSATPTVTAVATITIGGHVFRTGAGGLIGVEGAVVEAYRCDRRTLCIGTSPTPIATAVTNRSGLFTLNVPDDDSQHSILRFDVLLDGLPLRALLVKSRLAAALRSGTTADDPFVPIDPISEAGVRLLEETGAANFDDAGIAALLDAVAAANADTDFANLPLADAVTRAVTTAAAAPAVQTALGRAHPMCAGDCDAGGTVTIDELVRAVGIALGGATVDDCLNVDTDLDDGVAINEVIQAVLRALNGCS